MRIRNPQSENQRNRLKPPPNYGSRGVQLRLFALVALLMLVLTVAFEARNPDRWRWLWAFNEAQQADEEPIDPRLAVSPAEEREPGEIVIGGDSDNKINSPDDKTAEEKQPRPVGDRAWESGWEEVFEQLSSYDRTALYDLLKAARENQEVSEATANDAVGMIERLGEQWSVYHKQAAASLQDLTAEEKAAWTPVIDQLQARWEVETKPLLTAVAQRESLSATQRNHLQGLQALLDRLQLKAIQDNTVFRASEREIWFRLLGQLQQQPAAERKRDSAGLVGYAQLFKQSDFYRGKLVTVRGTAEAVYPIEAPRNSYGIQQYWVYWLRPEGGPNNPILVYALEKPQDFPSIQFAELGHKKMPSKEDVEFTGYFFKRYAYQGQGGIFTAPLLLAQGPEWLPQSLGPGHELPSVGFMLGLMAGLALLAAAFATWVYWQYRPGRPRNLSDRVKIPLAERP
jgi:hypothetical protein